MPHLGCFWCHDDLLVRLRRTEGLHVLVQNTNLLLIVPTRGTVCVYDTDIPKCIVLFKILHPHTHTHTQLTKVMWVGWNCLKHTTVLLDLVVAPGYKRLTWTQHPCPPPRHSPWTGGCMLCGEDTCAAETHSCLPSSRHKTTLPRLDSWVKEWIDSHLVNLQVYSASLANCEVVSVQ